MKYLFFDLEYATSKGGNIKICEFGYVVTDENFQILDRDNFIINYIQYNILMHFLFHFAPIYYLLLIQIN